MKKVVAILLVMILFSSTVQANTYYDYTSTEILGEGVERTEIERFASYGWQRINVVRADISVPHIKAGLLTDSRGDSYLSTVLKMAREENSIAAINGDFFARSGTSSSRGSAVGIVVEDKELLSTDNVTDGFASLGITEDKNILLDYFTTEVTITAPNGESREIKHINKYDPLDNMVIYTKEFDKMSGGSKNNILEVVVENGVITDMLQDEEPVEIPENGYVIRHLPEFDPFLVENFKVGDSVLLDVKLNFELDEMSLMAGGGTLLIKNGEKAPITHNVTGINPRTAAGTDETGKILYFVTIDGRQSDSKGVTMSRFQDILLELGIYNAINYDGGGSTTLVARNMSTGKQEVANIPSDGGLRAVPIGLQIKSDAPEGKLDGLVLGCDELKVFSGMSRSFYIKSAYDTYKNPYLKPLEDVKWSIDPRYGYFEGNILKAIEPGEDIEVVAECGNAKGTMKIDILPPPVKIEAKPSHFKVGGAKDFILTGSDADGFSATIEKDDYEMSPMPDGKMGTRTVRAGELETYITFSADETYDFEQLNAKADAYPSSTVKANYIVTEEKAKSGTKSGKLFFDFKNPDPATKAAYVVFNQPLKVEKEAAEIGLWVYSQFPMHQWLRAEFADGEGNIKRANLCEDIDFEGWKYLRAEIPEGCTELKKLYVVQNSFMVCNSGYLLFDDLCFIEKGDKTEYPNENKEQGKISVNNGESRSFIVMGGLPSANTFLSKIMCNQAVDIINKTGAEKVWFTGNADRLDAEGLRMKYKTLGDYESYIENNSQFIILNNYNDGISKTSQGQWDSFTKDMKKDYENLFLFMPINMNLTSDKAETKVLKDILADAAETKSVYVFCSDKTDDYYMERGVHYVSLAGMYSPNASLTVRDMKNYRYARVTLDGEKAKLTFENMY